MCVCVRWARAPCWAQMGAHVWVLNTRIHTHTQTHTRPIAHSPAHVQACKPPYTHTHTHLRARITAQRPRKPKSRAPHAREERALWRSHSKYFYCNSALIGVESALVLVRAPHTDTFSYTDKIFVVGWLAHIPRHRWCCAVFVVFVVFVGFAFIAVALVLHVKTRAKCTTATDLSLLQPPTQRSWFCIALLLLHRCPLTTLFVAIPTPFRRCSLLFPFFAIFSLIRFFVVCYLHGFGVGVGVGVGARC